MSDTLLSTVNHIGIRREHYDNTGDSTADYFIDYYNIVDFSVPQIKIIQPFEITDQPNGATTGRCKGSVTYTGTNSDLRWTIDNWTTTNSFTGTDSDQFDTNTTLTAGTYTLKVKDNTDATITAETTFIIQELKDYGLKYVLQFDDAAGQLCYINIYKDGYTGSQIEVCGTGDPAIIEWGSDSSDKWAIIKGSRATINLLTDSTTTNYNEFFTADDKDYRVDIKRAGTVVWSGYLITDEYSEAYLAPPYPIRLRASDRLGRLKSMPFQSRTGERFNNTRISIADLISVVFKDIYHTFGRIYTWCPLYPDGGSLSSTPTIAQTYIDTNIFYDEDPEADPPKWDEVLEKVLKPLGCRFFYSDDVFWIQYIQDPKAAVTYHFLAGPGTWLSTSRNFRLDVGCVGSESINFINRDQVKEMQPAYRDVCLDYKYKVQNDLVPLRSFTADSFIYPLVSGTDAKLWVESTPTWVEGNTPPYTQFSTLESYAYGWPAAAATYNPGNARYNVRALPFPLDISSGNTGKMKIEIKYHVQHSGANAGADHYWNFALLAGGHYLKQDNSWQALTLNGAGSDTDVDDILYQVKFDQGSNLDTEHTFELVTGSLPWVDQQDPSAQFRIYMSQGADSFALNFAIENITVEFLPDGGDALTERKICLENTSIKESSYTHEISIGYQDQPAAKTINRAQYFDSDGDVISLWKQTGKTGSKDLLEVLSGRINGEFNDFKPKLSGSFYGQYGLPDMMRIDSKTCLQDRQTYSVKKNQRKSVLLELSGSQYWPT